MALNLTGPGVVLLNWNLAKHSSGISHYRVYMDDDIIGNTIGNIGNYTVYNLPLGVKLFFKVVAIANDFLSTQESNTVEITLDGAGIKTLLNYNLNFLV